MKAWETFKAGEIIEYGDGRYVKLVEPYFAARRGIKRVPRRCLGWWITGSDGSDTMTTKLLVIFRDQMRRRKEREGL